MPLSLIRKELITPFQDWTQLVFSGMKKLAAVSW